MQRVEGLDPSIFAPCAKPRPEDVALQLAAADLDLGSGGPRRARCAACWTCCRRVGGDERDAVRERLVEYFDLLGAEDERVGPARREMARALF